MKQEMTAHGLATYGEPTFRTYEPIRSTNERGETVVMQLCEDLVEGRWEPFYSTISRGR